MADIIIKQRLIGQGAYGKVYTAFSRFTGDRLLAVKSSASSSLRKEEAILRCLEDCPYVVRCFGGYSSMEIDGSRVYNLVLEYAAGGSLKKLIQRSGGQLSESEVRVYARMILGALNYMHRVGLVHSDVKPDNILVFPGADGGNAVKMADFGLSRMIGMLEEVGFRCRGTPAYMSPESMALPEYDAPMDIWAFGCTVVEMIAGRRVWTGIKGVPALIDHVVIQGNVPEIPQNISACAKDFLGKCFKRDPKKRWTAEMLVTHPFIAPLPAEMLMTHPFIAPLPAAPTPIVQMQFSNCPQMSHAGQDAEISSPSSPSSMSRSLTELLPPHLLTSSSSDKPSVPQLQAHPGHRCDAETCGTLIGCQHTLIPDLTGLRLGCRC